MTKTGMTRIGRPTPQFEGKMKTDLLSQDAQPPGVGARNAIVHIVAEASWEARAAPTAAWDVRR